MHPSSAAAAMTACAESMISAGLVDSPLHPAGFLTREARDAVLGALISTAVEILARQRGLLYSSEGCSARPWIPVMESWLGSFSPPSGPGCPEILARLYQALLDQEVVVASASRPARDGSSSQGAEGVGQEWTSRSWNGRRKSSGSFYTPEDICRYMAGQGLAAYAGARPEQLLNLRICDPAAGTGSFLAAALHQTADLLRASLNRWNRIRPGGDKTACLLEEGHAPLELPGRPGEARFEGALGRALRRMVGQRCLFGADLDPHAASLCRHALWLEIGEASLSPDVALPGIICGDSLQGLPWWQAAFPGVFGSPREEPSWRAPRAYGFDLVLGNPPWDTLQPNSREFFSRIDPAYRALGKQEGLRRQAVLLDGNPGLRDEWEAVAARHRERVRLLRSGGLFRLQGRGKAYTYKLFLELADQVLVSGGRLALILPSGIYSDLESRQLRDMLLDAYEWESLYGMENRAKIFQADSRLKFCLIQARKGGTTKAVRTAFIRRSIPREAQAKRDFRSQKAGGYAEADDGLLYTRAQVRALSPRSRAFLELRSRRDQELMLKMTETGLGLGPRDDGAWRLSYRQGDLNLTGASRHFIRREEAEGLGFRPDLLGRWIRAERKLEIGGGQEVLLPILQGAMIGELAPFSGAYARGAGHGVRWRRETSVPDIPIPQFLIRAVDLRGLDPLNSVRIAVRTQSNATNARTMVAAPVEGFPCGNSLGLMRIADWSDLDHAAAAGFLCSLVYDWQLRQRMAGTNCNEFLLRETLWPRALHGTDGSFARAVIGMMAAELAFHAPRHFGLLQSVREEALRRVRNQVRAIRDPGRADGTEGCACRKAAALDAHSLPPPLPRSREERTGRLACLDAAAAVLMGLDREDLEWIVRDCSHPSRDLRDAAFTSRLDPRGFWRVDRDLRPESRRPQLALQAHDRLLRCIREAGGSWEAGLVRFVGAGALSGQAEESVPSSPA